MRGNLPAEGPDGTIPGSIPAYAGEPAPTHRELLSAAVYPRVCGGTTNTRALAITPAGLSPRMRGNLARASSSLSFSGSIPAYAGEPSVFSIQPPCRAVYPRVCGGTYRELYQNAMHEGLSPRMRGNPSVKHCRHPSLRSIPAYAGEPTGFKCRFCGHRVYPRVCGGTLPERTNSS